MYIIYVYNIYIRITYIYVYNMLQYIICNNQWIRLMLDHCSYFHFFCIQFPDQHFYSNVWHSFMNYNVSSQTLDFDPLSTFSSPTFPISKNLPSCPAQKCWVILEYSFPHTANLFGILKRLYYTSFICYVIICQYLIGAPSVETW